MSEVLDASNEDVNAAPTALPLPGATLRAAREAQGYSVAEVAQVLKFAVRQIEALESDDYSTLSGATFIRGFVRSYARFLRLDEAPLLAALEPQVPLKVTEVRPVDNMNAEMPDGSHDNSKRAYWLAAIVLVLGAVAWFAWQEQGTSEPAAPVAEPAASSAEPVAASEEPAPAAVQTAPALAPTPTVLEPAAPATSAEPAASVSPATPAAEAPAAAPNPNERQLQFSFSDVSWVEVRDASERIIYSGNSTPDTRQVLRGRPPFQLVIGNAQSVKLRYEGRNIDLQPYTRVDVARLTLDDNTK